MFRVIGGMFRRAPWEAETTTKPEDEKASTRPFWVELYPPGCRMPTQHFERKKHRATAIQRGFKRPNERDIPVTEEMLTRTPNGKVIINRGVLESKLRKMLFKTGIGGRRLRASSLKKMTIGGGATTTGKLELDHIFTVNVCVCVQLQELPKVQRGCLLLLQLPLCLRSQSLREECMQ